jgi:hypothetical protein
MLYRRGLLPDLSGVGVKGGFSARNERVTQLSPQRKGWVRDNLTITIPEHMFTTFVLLKKNSKNSRPSTPRRRQFKPLSAGKYATLLLGDARGGLRGGVGDGSDGRDGRNGNGDGGDVDGA